MAGGFTPPAQEDVSDEDTGAGRLWRYMQLIEASRHRAELLEAQARRGSGDYRRSLEQIAAQRRELADQLYDRFRRRVLGAPRRRV